MKWNERRNGDVVVIDLKGKLTLGSGDVQLRSIIRDLLDRDEKNILPGRKCHSVLPLLVVRHTISTDERSTAI